MVLFRTTSFVHSRSSHFHNKRVCRANIRALKSAPKALVAQLLFYVRYFHKTPQAIVVNVALYACCYYLYIWPFVVTALPNENTRNEAALKVGILVAELTFNVINLFFLVNLVFASLKRIGPKLGLKPPFGEWSWLSVFPNRFSHFSTK